MNRQNNFNRTNSFLNRGFGRDRPGNNDCGNIFEEHVLRDNSFQNNYDRHNETYANNQRINLFQSDYIHADRNENVNISGFSSNYSRDTWPQNNDRGGLNINSTRRNCNMKNRGISESRRNSLYDQDERTFPWNGNSNNNDNNNDSREYRNRIYGRDDATPLDLTKHIEPAARKSLSCTVCNLEFDNVEIFQVHAISVLHINNATLAVSISNHSDAPPIKNISPTQNFKRKCLTNQESLAVSAPRRQSNQEIPSFTDHGYREVPTTVSHSYQERSMPVNHQIYQDELAPARPLLYTPNSNIRPLLPNHILQNTPVSQTSRKRTNNANRGKGILGSYNLKDNPAFNLRRKRPQNHSISNGQSISVPMKQLSNSSSTIELPPAKIMKKRRHRHKSKKIKQTTQQMDNTSPMMDDSSTMEQKQTPTKAEILRCDSNCNIFLSPDEFGRKDVAFEEDHMEIELNFDPSHVPMLTSGMLWDDAESVKASLEVDKEFVSPEGWTSAMSEIYSENKNNAGNDSPGAGDDAGGEPIGQEFVIPVTGFFCKLCSKFYNKEVMAKQMHCRSEEHIARFKKEQSLKA